MAVPTGCRIAFSFTAFSLAICTIICAIRKPRVTCVGHVIVALLTTGLAVVSTYSAVSHNPVDRATISILCAAIGTSTLFKFETLKKSGLLCALPVCVLPYTSKYVFVRMLARLKIEMVVITFVRMSACLQIGMVVMLAKGYRAHIGSSILLLSVALEYAFLGTIVLFLHWCAVERDRSSLRHVVRQLCSSFKGTVQQFHFWLMTLASLVCSILGFSFQDMGLINWSLWALLLLILLHESLLLAYNAVIDEQLVGYSEQMDRVGSQATPEDQVWRNVEAADFQSQPPLGRGDNVQLLPDAHFGRFIEAGAGADSSASGGVDVSGGLAGGVPGGAGVGGDDDANMGSL